MVLGHMTAGKPPPDEVVQVADGVKARRFTRVSPLPPSLDTLLARLAHVQTRTVALHSTRRACTDGEHERVPWITGVYAGLHLRLDVCPWCHGVEVRDISYDMRPGLQPGRRGPARRSDVLGWYSGRRPAGRTFM